MKRKVDVVLLGHRFAVRTEKDEAFVHSLATQVATRVNEVRRTMRNATAHEQALLVALQLVEELNEERERAVATRAEVRHHTEAMIAKLSAALLEDTHGLHPQHALHAHKSDAGVSAGVSDGLTDDIALADDSDHAVAVTMQRRT